MLNDNKSGHCCCSYITTCILVIQLTVPVCAVGVWSNDSRRRDGAEMGDWRYDQHIGLHLDQLGHQPNEAVSQGKVLITRYTAISGADRCTRKRDLRHVIRGLPGQM